MSQKEKMPERIFLAFENYKRFPVSEGFDSWPCRLEEQSDEDVAYVPEAALAEARREARAEALQDVLTQAERIYQEEMESDPSDYFYTKRAVEAATQAPVKKEG